ncbi:hypothetical protein F5X98DRAFT_336602 [Xylaria grammica]|nr:hypothetical protein F5X98DRAFT_336602 [Xylaria grammica]
MAPPKRERDRRSILATPYTSLPHLRYLYLSVLLLLCNVIYEHSLASATLSHHEPSHPAALAAATAFVCVAIPTYYLA